MMMAQNMRTWLMATTVTFLGMGATAWAGLETNPHIEKPPCINPCGCDLLTPPSNGPRASSCSSCSGGSASGAPIVDGMLQASVNSLDVSIVSGITPHGEMGNGQLYLHASQPHAGLFSPSGLKFPHPVMEKAILSVKTTGLAAGIAREVVVKGKNDMPITFQFQVGSSAGYATDLRAAKSAWLKMTDASGAPVTDTPAMYVICYRGTSKMMLYSTTVPYACAGYQNEGGRIITSADVGFEVVRDASNVLRQVKSAYSLADIVVPAGMAGKKYEVRFYNPDQVGAKENGVYAVSGDPFTVVTVENIGTHQGDVDHLRVTRMASGTTNVYDYAYVDAQKMWSLTSGNGLKTEKVSLVKNPTTGVLTTR